jgi:hypothetical protein
VNVSEFEAFVAERTNTGREKRKMSEEKRETMVGRSKE